MTIFYVILYYVWRLRYHAEGQKNTAVLVYLLAALRIALCLFPQNHWLGSDAPLSWGIYRNIPFALLGLLILPCSTKAQSSAKTMLSAICG